MVIDADNATASSRLSYITLIRNKVCQLFGLRFYHAAPLFGSEDPIFYPILRN